MRKLVNYFIANVIPGISGYLMIPIFGAFLTKSEYGVVGKLEVFTYIYSILALLAIDRAVVRFYFETNIDSERKLIISSAIWLAIFLTLVSFVVGIALILFTNVFRLGHLNSLLYLMMATGISAHALIASRIMQARGESVIFLYLQLVKSIAALVFVYIFLGVFEGGVQGYALGMLFGAIFVIPIITREYSRFLRFQICFSTIKSLLSFSLPLIPTLLSAWVFTMYGRVVVEDNFDLRALGEFTMSFKVTSVMLTINSALVLTITPIFFKLINTQKNIGILSRMILITHKVSSVLFLAFVILINDIVNFVLPEYKDINPYIGALATSLYISCSMSYCSNLIVMHFKKTLVHMCLYLLSSVIVIVTTELLVLPYGVMGVCFGLILSNFFLFGIHTKFSSKLSTIKLPGLMNIAVTSFGLVCFSYLGGWLSELGGGVILSKYIVVSLVLVYIIFKLYVGNKDVFTEINKDGKLV